MHDIIVDLGPKKKLDVEELSSQLQSDYKITISPFFLDKFLDDFLKVKSGDRKAKTFFTKADARWLGVRNVGGTKELRNNLLYLKPSLTKHKRKLFLDEDKKKLDDAYASGMKDLSFSEDVIKKSLVLQRPEDGADIMKLIYSDVVINSKYENTYDNCWKLMMLIGKNNKLDRARGWYKLAPQSVKDEFNNGKQGQKMINYELTKPPVPKKPVVKSNPKREPIESSDTTVNIDIVDNYLTRYKSWSAFISDTTLRDLIELIESLHSKKDVEFNEFLRKIDEINLIFIKYYYVDKKDVITFYRNIGLAGYLREWENNKNRPKINTF